MISGSMAPAFSRAAAPGARRSVANRRTMSMTRVSVPPGCGRAWLASLRAPRYQGWLPAANSGGAVVSDVDVVVIGAGWPGWARRRPCARRAAARWCWRRRTGSAAGPGPRIPLNWAARGSTWARCGCTTRRPTRWCRSRGRRRDAAAVGRAAGRAHLRRHARGDGGGIRRLRRCLDRFENRGGEILRTAAMRRWPRSRGRCRTILGR